MASLDNTNQHKRVDTGLEIQTSTGMTAQQLIDFLQAAIKENPAMAAMKVVIPDYQAGPLSGNEIHEVTVNSHCIRISDTWRNSRW